MFLEYMVPSEWHLISPQFHPDLVTYLVLDKEFYSFLGLSCCCVSSKFLVLLSRCSQCIPVGLFRPMLGNFQLVPDVFWILRHCFYDIFMNTHKNNSHLRKLVISSHSNKNRLMRPHMWAHIDETSTHGQTVIEVWQLQFIILQLPSLSLNCCFREPVNISTILICRCYVISLSQYPDSSLPRCILVGHFHLSLVYNQPVPLLLLLCSLAVAMLCRFVFFPLSAKASSPKIGFLFN